MQHIIDRLSVKLLLIRNQIPETTQQQNNVLANVEEELK
jgi:hypothetical protein